MKKVIKTMFINMKEVGMDMGFRLKEEMGLFQVRGRSLW